MILKKKSNGRNEIFIDRVIVCMWERERERKKKRKKERKRERVVVAVVVVMNFFLCIYIIIMRDVCVSSIYLYF